MSVWSVESRNLLRGLAGLQVRVALRAWDGSSIIHPPPHTDRDIKTHMYIYLYIHRYIGQESGGILHIPQIHVKIMLAFVIVILKLRDKPLLLITWSRTDEGSAHEAIFYLYPNATLAKGGLPKGPITTKTNMGFF